MNPLSRSPYVNLLAHSPIDRLAHLRNRSEWIEEVLYSGAARFLPTQGSRSLVHVTDPPRPALLSTEELGELGAGIAAPVLLGIREQRYFFSVPVGKELPLPASFEFRDLRPLAGLLEPWEASLLAYARAMAIWHRNHAFCARCGSGTELAEAGHARVCVSEECGRRHFPKVDPAVIVLVAHDERCLLGRQASWPQGRFSTIAGFVEPGESLEDAVRREVYEETGVRVSDVIYHSSQPWPFPSSLMLGFLAEARTEEIQLLDGELSEARWVSREDIVKGETLLPPPVSIAYALVREWFNAEPGFDLDRQGESGPPVWR